MNRVLTVLFAAVLNVAALAVPARADDRKPVPPANSVEAAKRLVVDTFRKELSASDKVPAIRAMLETAAKAKSDDAARLIDVTIAPNVVMQFVKVPASADGKVKSFYLGRTEVTQQQPQAVMGSNPSDKKGDQSPVTMMTYKDCLAFCDNLNSNKQNGGAGGRRFKFRIPSKAELHYACFLGLPVDAAFPGNIADYAWFKSTAAGHPHPAAQKKPNRLGIYDLLGNVWEWTSDETYLFGGGYDVPDWYCRNERLVTPNGRTSPGTRWNNYGIRIAADHR